MSAITILDPYYLAITFLISLFLQTSAFLVSFSLQTDKLTDLMGSLNFLVLSLFTVLVSRTSSARNLVVSIMIIVWATRLGGFLFFRVLKTGKDGRFDEMRSKFWSFAGFWTFQLMWCWIVSMPVTILNSPAVLNTGARVIAFGTATDIIGVTFWVIGFLLEVVGE